MKAKHDEIDGARRGFFRTAAGVGVAAGTGALILRGDLARAQPGDRAAPKGAHYRETEHIRKYYQTARG